MYSLDYFEYTIVVPSYIVLRVSLVLKKKPVNNMDGKSPSDTYEFFHIC